MPKGGGRVHLVPAGETGRKRHDAKARDEANADPATAFAYDAKWARNGDWKIAGWEAIPKVLGFPGGPAGSWRLGYASWPASPARLRPGGGELLVLR